MTPQIIVSPFALDSPMPALERLAGPTGSINALPSAEGHQRSRLGAIHRALADRVEAEVRRGRRPVSIAGDCLQTAGVLAGLRRAGLDPVLVWLDAHGDFNTPETSPSGFIGGMPLAMLVGRGEPWLRDNVGLSPLDERDVILCDARDLDPDEAIAIKASRVVVVRHVDQVAERVPESRPVYVHFDTDVLDTREAPAMLFAVPGGPSTTTLRQMAEALHRAHHVVAVSMTAWALDRDADGRTERACLDVLDALLAR
jgi:arginase